jgi:3-deoxy-D-manno-octulosonic-acid transferase
VIRLLYNVLLVVLSPLWVPWMLRRSSRRAERVNWRERFGYLPVLTGPRKRIWVHAVSVGEVVACLPILAELRKHDLEIILSVTTSSGHETARKQAADLYDQLVYLPLDLPWMTRRAMHRIRPHVLAIMETELWLNLLHSAKSVGAQTILLNGRISDRSFPRSQKIKFFYQELFKSLDLGLVQTEIDAQRLATLGAKKVTVTGNVKFDQAATGLASDPAKWRSELGLTLPTVVVGSLRAEEFASVVPALLDLAQTGQVVLAPRHIDRLPELLTHFPAPPKQRSQKDKLTGPGVLILDTYGELNDVYSAADVVIVGGGFADLGGQNIIQPLAHGKPVLHGRHMQNFRDVAAMAKNTGAAMVITPENLVDEVTKLLNNPARRAKMGAAARALVQQNLGAARRDAIVILEAL